MSQPSVGGTSAVGASASASASGSSASVSGASGSSASVADDELLTGEAVALDVRPASFLLRSASGAIDFAAYVLPLIGAIWVFSAVVASGVAFDPALTQALSIALVIAFLVIAPIVVEFASGGRSLGRLVIGARIVRDDGGSIALRHSIIRGLLGFVEIFATFGGLAFVTSLLNSRSKRLGDLLAGTYSQHERVPAPRPFSVGVPAELALWAQTADVAKLPDRLSRRLVAFLTQASRMTPATRARLAHELAAETSPFVSPLPNVHPETFLVGVAALRRDREYRALMIERERLSRVDPVLRGLPNGFPDR
ncbi:RDD family protein [Herbiconiux sp. CPCC 205716]|uniref:RDD family protein n=1 Tax=Herbiconiux gentiana TaxID=2970912 RepID=A0ABT2GN44_9MICO|nr:RDD family protein [Herbiconiux gentiana]MCS5716329.1 RDD family protein [Herbiconiux gentiana]